MNNPSTALISVIVPVRDDPDGIRELLERLARQTIPPERFEVVIGDDGSQPESQPESLAEVDTEGGRVRVVAGPPKTSYAARNRAARAARGEVFAFCDSDCRPEPTWLERGLEALAEADIVAGEVIFDPPSRPTVWSLLTIDMFLDQGRNVLRSASVTANLLVRRHWFDRVGGFDESLPSGGDYDFTRRIVSRGARLIHAPEAIVYHPTLDRARSFLRKVWFTNRWSGVRRARYGLRPDLKALTTFVPFIGVVLARRHAQRPVLRLCRPRLAAAGLAPGWRENLKAIPVLYLIVAYVAGLARVRGWLDVRRALRRGTEEGSPFAIATMNGRPSARSDRRADRATPTAGAAAALPNLVVIGAQKCGTSALHFYLDLHPAISMSRPKELNFFIESRNWGRGLAWYRRHFDAAATVRGEASPNYTAYPRYSGVPERMASVIPDARLIYLVRDPVERIAAHWVHNYAKRREKGDLRTTLLHEKTSYVARSRYHFQLRRFCEHFDPSQILVLDSHELRHRRLYALRRVFEFVGLPADFYHPRFERVRHRTASKRRATRLGASVLPLRRSAWGRVLPGRLWRFLEVGLPLSRPIGPPPEIRDALGPEVLEALREDANRLREFTGQKFAHWTV